MAVVPAKWIQNRSDELAVERGCTFDAEAGQFVCDFLETFCVQSKGKWKGQPLSLLEWERDFVMRLFGWRLPDGRRRFRRFYLEIAKKNGKSTLLSALALALSLLSADGAPEIYILACDRDQASIIFDESARMVRASPELKRRLDVLDYRKRIIDPATDGKIVACSALVDQKDGLNMSAALFDELHRQRTRGLWDVMAYAGASREQPLLGSITTAGEDTTGIWHEQRLYSEKVHDGVIQDITHLGVVYRASEEDDIDLPATWRKANPSLGVTISEEEFKRELEEAKQSPAALQNFKRLRLNIVARGIASYLSVEQWDRCEAAAVLRPKAPTWAGLDLSSDDDLTALLAIQGNEEDGFDIVPTFWLPEDGIAELERKHQQPYREWARMGLITLTPGNVVDYGFIRKAVVDLATLYDLRMLFSDPWNGMKLALELKNEDGLNVEFLRQGMYSLSGPTKELRRLVKAARIRHGAQPILRWHVVGAVVEEDAAGNLKLNKKKSNQKIDGAAALVNGIAAYLSHKPEEPSVYEEHGILFM